MVPAYAALQVQAQLSPDGQTVLVSVPGDDPQVVAVSLADPGEPSVLTVPESEGLFGRFMADGRGYARARTADGIAHHRYADGKWATYIPKDKDFGGFPAAPEVHLQWEGSGKQRTVKRMHRDTGEVLDTFEVQIRPGRGLVWDTAGRPRAVSVSRGKGVRYRALKGEPRWRVPKLYPWAQPEGGRTPRRRGRRPLAVIEDALWLLDTADREFLGLHRIDVRSGERSTVSEAPDGDVILTSDHPDTGTPDMVLVLSVVPRWEALDAGLAEDLDTLVSALPGPPTHIGRARGDRVWHACGTAPHDEVVCLALLRDSGDLVATFRADPVPLPRSRRPRSHGVTLQTPDGLSLHSYLVLPPEHDVAGRPPEPRPTIIRMHGGPYAREFWAYEPMHAYLATRGYAILELNYRGSTFMGTSVHLGADGERGRGTQHDVYTAVDWLIAEGIADPDRIALMGHSFGGYATVLGLGQQPERFACGVALAPTAAWSYRAIVPLLPRGLRARAPYTLLDRVDDPLLLIHGTEDEVLPVRESQHVATSLLARKHPVMFIEVGEDGHGLTGPGTERMRAEAIQGFLGRCLGGEATPVDRATWPERAIVTGDWPPSGG